MKKIPSDTTGNRSRDRLVAQRLKHYATPGPFYVMYWPEDGLPLVKTRIHVSHIIHINKSQQITVLMVTVNSIIVSKTQQDVYQGKKIKKQLLYIIN